MRARHGGYGFNARNTEYDHRAERKACAYPRLNFCNAYRPEGFGHPGRSGAGVSSRDLAGDHAGLRPAADRAEWPVCNSNFRTQSGDNHIQLAAGQVAMDHPILPTNDGSFTAILSGNGLRGRLQRFIVPGHLEYAALPLLLPLPLPGRRRISLAYGRQLIIAVMRDMQPHWSGQVVGLFVTFCQGLVTVISHHSVSSPRGISGTGQPTVPPGCEYRHA